MVSTEKLSENMLISPIVYYYYFSSCYSSFAAWPFMPALGFFKVTIKNELTKLDWYMKVTSFLF